MELAKKRNLLIIYKCATFLANNINVEKHIAVKENFKQQMCIAHKKVGILYKENTADSKTGCVF